MFRACHGICEDEKEENYLLHVLIFLYPVFRACHGSCDDEKEENYVLHVLNEGLVILERHYSRRNR